jgi:UDP-glucose:(heptosyl)LPS alpha-1,3-glucosyltransferase
MRLGVLIDRLGERRGGAETHTWALLERAREEGDDPVVAVLDDGATSAPPGVAVVRVRTPRRRPARDRAFADEGERRLREAGCDVVLAVRHAPRCDVYLPHGGLVADAVRAADLARRRGLVRRAARVLSGKWRYFLEAESALLDAQNGPQVIAVSRRLAARLRALHPACADRLTVVPNGVDVERFRRDAFLEGRARVRREMGVPDDAYVGLLLAHDAPLKGAETAVLALGHDVVHALDPPFHLLVVGGRLRGLAARASSRGARDRLHLSGPVADPRPVLAAADVLVHPTWYDPCSIVCLEALAMEVPVVTTPENGVAELMGAKGGIVLEEPGNPEALAVALRVLADPALRRSTGEDARWIAERHRAATRLDQVLDVCRRARDRGAREG